MALSKRNISREAVEVINEVVKSRLDDAEIASIKIDLGEDSDGDPVINIFVVVETGKKKEVLDGKKMSGVARLLMEKLFEMEVDAFPMLNFISKKDAASLNLEAA